MGGGGLGRDCRMLLPVLSCGRRYRGVLRRMGWLMRISGRWRAPLSNMGIVGITRRWRVLCWVVLCLFVRWWNDIGRRRRVL